VEDSGEWNIFKKAS